MLGAEGGGRVTDTTNHSVNAYIRASCTAVVQIEVVMYMYVHISVVLP